jgi:hypothetical protein
MSVYGCCFRCCFRWPHNATTDACAGARRCWLCLAVLVMRAAPWGSQLPDEGASLCQTPNDEQRRDLKPSLTNSGQKVVGTRGSPVLQGGELAQPRSLRSNPAGGSCQRRVFQALFEISRNRFWSFFSRTHDHATERKLEYQSWLVGCWLVSKSFELRGQKQPTHMLRLGPFP